MNIVELKIFLDEMINQLAKINKNLDYIVNDISTQRALESNILRKGINDGN